jgi:hypothetical protein
LFIRLQYTKNKKNTAFFPRPWPARGRCFLGSPTLTKPIH